MLTDDHKDIIGALFIILAMVLIIAVWSCVAQADYTLAFTDPTTCRPCQLEEPTIKQAIAKGCDIRVVDPYRHPDLRRFYHVTRWPCFVYVLERNGKSYDSGLRLYYPVNLLQLTEFAAPKIPIYDPWPVANTLRWALGAPPIVVTW